MLWAKILDNKGQVDTFILDFEKAFDTHPHKLLKSKLFSYGIGGTIDRLFPLLQTTASCCKWSEVRMGSDAPVSSGVLQGTVLCCSHCISTRSQQIVSLKLDNLATIVSAIVKLRKRRKNDIDRVCARKWGMRFRPVKCKIMQLTRKQTKKINAEHKLEGSILQKSKC